MCTLHDKVTRLDVAEREMKRKAERLEEEKRRFEEERREFRRLTMVSPMGRKSGVGFILLLLCGGCVTDGNIAEL